MLSKAAQTGLYSGMQASGYQPMPGYPQPMPAQRTMPRPNPAAPTKPSRGALVARMAMYGPKYNQAMSQLASTNGQKSASLSKEAAAHAGRWIAKTLAGLGWKSPMQYARKGVNLKAMREAQQGIKALKSTPGPIGAEVGGKLLDRNKALAALRAQRNVGRNALNDRYNTIAGTAAAVPLALWLATRQPVKQQNQQAYPQEQ